MRVTINMAEPFWRKGSASPLTSGTCSSAKKIALLRSMLGVKSIADLKRVCESGEAAKLPGFGAKTAEKLLQGISFRESHAHGFRQEQVAPIVMGVLEMLRDHPDVSRVEVAGSYRRGKETVHDLDFLAASRRPKEVLEDFEPPSDQVN